MYIYIYRERERYIYTYMHICIYTYTHVYVYTYIHVYIYTYMHMCVYIYIERERKYTYIYTYAYMRVYIYIYICISLSIYIYIYICIYIYIERERCIYTRSVRDNGNQAEADSCTKHIGDADSVLRAVTVVMRIGCKKCTPKSKQEPGVLGARTEPVRLLRDTGRSTNLSTQGSSSRGRSACESGASYYYYS